MKKYTISTILNEANKNPEGWFCLPIDHHSWTLDTIGSFTDDSSNYEPESEEYLPLEVRNGKWIVTLDNATIEDIVLNIKDQKENATAEDLLIAFIYYFENDAFLIL
jgi:hypothetical protein